MEQKVTLSDFTTTIIPGDEVIKVIIRHHPSIEGDYELDASEAEVKPLLASAGDYVVLDLIKGDKVKSVVAELTTFNGLFTDDPYQSLKNARPVKAKRANNSNSGNSSDLAKIREWATSQGIEVAPKGRIKADVVEAYRAAQAALWYAHSAAGTAGFTTSRGSARADVVTAVRSARSGSSWAASSSRSPLSRCGNARTATRYSRAGLRHGGIYRGCSGSSHA
jgi:hypothetical protein